MIKTGDEYRESIRDGREVWIDGEKVADVTTHPAFKPIVDIRARIYDLAHEDGTREVMTYADDETGEVCAIGSKPPVSKEDWHAKRRALTPSSTLLAGSSLGSATKQWARCGRCTTDKTFLTRLTRPSRRTSSVTYVMRLSPTRSTFRRTPILRAASRSGHRIKIPTSCCAWWRRTTTASLYVGAKFETAAAYAQPSIRQADNRRMEDAERLQVRRGIPRRYGCTRHQAHLPVGVRR